MASGSSSDRNRCKHTDVETEEVCVCAKFDSTKSEDKLLCGRCGHHASFHVPGDANKSRPGRCSERSDSVCEDGCQEFFSSRDPKLQKNCGGCGCHRYDHLTEVEVEGVLPRNNGGDIVAPESGPAGDESNAVDRDGALDSKHKIFLSFSGAQRHFAKKLYGKLVECDRYPFYDRQRSCLPLGENAPNLMWEAIKTCRIGVVILSEEYFTRTKWPMLEFVRMVRELKRNENPIKIIPVFLGISHDDCRDRKKHEHWSKTWEKWASLEKNKQLYNIDVAEWVQSVQEFFDQPLQRLELRSDGRKRDLREEIVDAIRKEIRPESTFALPNVQGHARLYENFRKMVFPEADRENENLKVHVVGLYGMGGAGKTTLCKVLRYELSTKFRDKVCHVELGKLNQDQVYRKVIRELVDLEPQIMDNLKDVTDPSVFLHHLNSIKLGKRVFLAIDNVTDEHEMMDLSSTLKNVKWRNGSVVLFAARSQDVLSRIGIDPSQCFKMLDLTREEAKALFLNSVRSVDSDVTVDEALILQCLDRCYFNKGVANNEHHWHPLDVLGKHWHPLALDVLGKHWHPLALDVLGKQLMFSFGYKPDCWKRQLGEIDTFNSTHSVSEKHPIFSILRSSFDALRYEEKLLFMDAALFWRVKDYNTPLRTLSNWRSISKIIDDGEGSKPPRDLGDRFDFLMPTRAHDVVSEFKWLGMVHEREDDELKNMLDSLKRKSVLETVSDDAIYMHDLWVEFAVEQTTLGKITERCWIYERELRLSRGLWKGDKVRSMMLGVREAVNLRNVDLTGFPMISVLGVFGLRPNMTLNVHKLNLLKSLEVTSSTFGGGFDIKGLGTLESLSFLRIWHTSNSAWFEEIKDLANLQILDLERFAGDKLPDLRGLTNLQVLNIRRSWNLESVDLENLPNLTDLDVDYGTLKELNLSSCKSLRNVWGLKGNRKLQELRISSCLRLEELPGLEKCEELIVLNIFDCPCIESVPELGRLKKLKEVVINGRSLMEDLEKKTSKRTRSHCIIF